MLKIGVGDVVLVLEGSAPPAVARGVNLPFTDRTKALDGVIAVVLTAEHGSESVLSEVVRPGHVAVVFPFGDYVVETLVLLKDPANAFGSYYGGLPDRLGGLASLSRGVDPGILVGDRLQESGVAVGVFGRGIALVKSRSTSCLDHPEVERLEQEFGSLRRRVVNYPTLLRSGR